MKATITVTTYDYKRESNRRPKTYPVHSKELDINVFTTNTLVISAKSGDSKGGLTTPATATNRTLVLELERVELQRVFERALAAGLIDAPGRQEVSTAAKEIEAALQKMSGKPMKTSAA